MTLTQYIEEAGQYIATALGANNRSASVRGIGKRAATGLSIAQSAQIDGEEDVPEGASRKRMGYWRIVRSSGKVSKGFVPGYVRTASELPEDWETQVAKILGAEASDTEVGAALGQVARYTETDHEAYQAMASEEPANGNGNGESAPKAETRSVRSILGALS